MEEPVGVDVEGWAGVGGCELIAEEEDDGCEEGEDAPAAGKAAHGGRI